MILNSIIERVVILSPTCGSFDLGTPLSPLNERAALDVLCGALDERLQLLSNLSTGRSDGDGGGGGDGGGEESDTVMDALFRENAFSASTTTLWPPSLSFSKMPRGQSQR